MNNLTDKDGVVNKPIINFPEEKILFTTEFSKDEIQSFAEANFGRELTDVELNRISEHWHEIDGAFSARDELIGEAIEGSMNNKDNSWSGVDEDYIKSLKDKK